MWGEPPLAVLEAAAAASPAQAAAVVRALEWLATGTFSVARPVPGTEERYWAVPPFGVFCRLDDAILRILRVVHVGGLEEPSDVAA